MAFYHHRKKKLNTSTCEAYENALESNLSRRPEFELASTVQCITFHDSLPLNLPMECNMLFGIITNRRTNVEVIMSFGHWDCITSHIDAN